MFLLTLAKVLLRSRRPAPKGSPKDTPIVILANGPSLRTTLDNDLPALQRLPLLAVNFAANTPEFFSLRPSYYVLADPHFFRMDGKDPNVDRLWQNIRNADWEMTLFVPARGGRVGELPSNITVKRFNMTPADDASAGNRWLFRAGLAMPRPRNVLIPAIMLALREGYREIYLTGADHTWTRTLWVDDENRVVSVQPHFYKDGEKELKRVKSDYEGLHIHDVLGSMAIAFRSYHILRRYAATLGARILNATPGSFIDAFPRKLD